MKKIIALTLALLLMLSITACSGKPEIASAAPSDNSGNAGKTSASDPYGRSAYDAVVSRNEITLVTVLATWSTPCEGMISTLQEVSGMRKVGVVALISDAVDESSYAVDDETMEYAKELMAAKNADFTIVAPDKDLFVNFCAPTEFYPTSYIVDAEGKVISSPIIAAADSESLTEALSAALESASNAG